MAGLSYALILNMDLLINPVCIGSNDCRSIYALDGSYADRRRDPSPDRSGKRSLNRSLISFGRRGKSLKIFIVILEVIDASRSSLDSYENKEKENQHNRRVKKLSGISKKRVLKWPIKI